MTHHPNLFCVRGALTAIAALAAMAVSSSASAQSSGQPSPPRPQGQAAQPQAPQAAQIDRNGVLILIRSTLLALHHANQTGNYTVLRDLGAPSFQAANTAARLAEIFASERAQNLDLSGVAVLEPQLTRLPEIVQGGLMHMAGFFPSVPLQVNFELLFAPVEGKWRLFGISLNVGQTAPSAPQPAVEAPKPNPAVADDKPGEAKRPAEVLKPAPRHMPPPRAQQPARTRSEPQPSPGEVAR